METKQDLYREWRELAERLMDIETKLFVEDEESVSAFSPPAKPCSTLAWMTAIIDNADDAIAFLDRNFRLRAFNRTFQKLAREVFGMNIEAGTTFVPEIYGDATGPEAASRWSALFSRVAEGMVREEYRHVFDNGQEAIFSVCLFPISREGKTVGLSLMARDLTVFRNCQEMVARAKRLKGEFIANLNHEIRTPLNGILGMTDMLAATTLSQNQRECLDVIRCSGEMLLRVFQDILDIGAIDTGGFSLRKRPFDLFNAIEHLIKSIAARAVGKKIRIGFDYQDTAPRLVWGDDARLKHVVFHLLDNSLKFTREGHIQTSLSVVGAFGKGNVFQLAVADTGPGIPPEFRDKVFEAFYQVDGSSTRLHGGAGIGLTICSRLAKMMGGDIRYEDGEKGGAVFYFTVPLEVREQPQVTPALPLPIVLVVDDDTVSRGICKTALEKNGFQILLAESGEEALRIFQEQKVDLVLMDIQMPRYDGFETATAMRVLEKEKSMRVPIIGLSASKLENQKAQTRNAGIDDYLLKPISAAALAAKIHQWTR